MYTADSRSKRDADSRVNSNIALHDKCNKSSRCYSNRRVDRQISADEHNNFIAAWNSPRGGIDRETSVIIIRVGVPCQSAGERCVPACRRGGGAKLPVHELVKICGWRRIVHQPIFSRHPRFSVGEPAAVKIVIHPVRCNPGIAAGAVQNKRTRRSARRHIGLEGSTRIHVASGNLAPCNTRRIS